MSIWTRGDKQGVVYEAWTRSCMAFIRERGMEQEFKDFCGGWSPAIAGTASMIAAAPEMFSALRGDPEMPAVISPLSWLRSAIDELVQRGPGDDCDDVSAYWEMINELRSLHANGQAAIAKAEDRP